MISLKTTLASIAIATLFSAYSNANYKDCACDTQRYEISLRHHNKMNNQNILFDFMTANHALIYLEKTIDDISNEADRQSTCQQWPFRQLHYQLGKKLSLRVNNEISPKDEEFAEFKKGIISMIFEDLKYTKDELQTILEMIYLNAEYIKKYPNTLDSLSLLVSYNHEQSPINDLRSELTENQTQQLLQEIFDFNLKNYYQFIQCHNAIFSRISEIVDNDFVVEKLIIRDGEGKKICKFNKEKEFCITQRAKKEIKTFSELLKHVKLEPLMSHAEKNFPNEDTNKVE